MARKLLAANPQPNKIPRVPAVSLDKNGKPLPCVMKGGTPQEIKWELILKEIAGESDDYQRSHVLAIRRDELDMWSLTQQDMVLTMFETPLGREVAREVLSAHKNALHKDTSKKMNALMALELEPIKMPLPKDPAESE